VQMAPEYGGLVQEVYVTTNEPVKKGQPLFKMDPTEWQARVDLSTAKLAAADTNVAELNEQVVEARAAVRRAQANLQAARVKYRDLDEAAKLNAVSQLRMEESAQEVESREAALESAEAGLRAATLALESEVGDQHTEVAEALAELKLAQYNLDHTTVVAPSDGYVANLQLYPGAFIRLKQPVMAFVNSEDHWLVATVLQRGVHKIRPGDKAQVAFEMYPGKLFDAKVESVTWAAGNSQGVPSGVLPRVEQIRGARQFMVRLDIEENPDYPLRFGASGLVAIYSSDAAGFLVLLRQIELQSESFLNYLYNPFE